jgi:hypothetical protein
MKKETIEDYFSFMDANFLFLCFIDCILMHSRFCIHMWMVIVSLS